jgi:hypothetical protein
VPVYPRLYLAITILCLGLKLQAQPAPAYPEGPLTAQQIAEQVHLATHNGLVRNALSERNKQTDEIALIVNRAPLEKRPAGSRPNVSSFETYLNNPTHPTIASQRMAIIKSGKSRGTGFLLTSYRESQRSSNMLIWLPVLRKIRRVIEPDPQDFWFGTTLTYGELVLRKPQDETHELLGEGVLEGCLASMQLEPAEMTRYTRTLPGPQCAHRGRPIYRLKSTTQQKDWWYDYHLSEIDKQTFAPYRTVYFKNGKRLKTIAMDWQSLDESDPRITYPRYIYALMHGDGRDSLVYVPRSTIRVNVDLPDRFWSELTLKKKAR